MPGVTHWNHPRFFAYFPASSSPPAILGDLLSSGLGVQGMLWATSPACTELETHLLDWLVDMLGLPAYLPPEPGVVRMDSVEGEWLFVPEGSEVVVQLTIHVEPGARVPKFLANRRLAQSVGRTLAGLARNFPCATSREAMEAPGAAPP